MGIDVSACSMYGIECDSLSDAAELLVAKGIMSEEEADESLDCGELQGEHDYGFTVYSCYSGGEGVLGIYIDAEDFYMKPSCAAHQVVEVKNVFPEAKFHLFCQWY